jgi:hypothetical protein
MGAYTVSDVACPKCGREVGEKCVRVYKGQISATEMRHVHDERRKALAAVMKAQGQSYEDAEVTIGESPFFGEGLKARRIDQVLWAIGFARNVMCIPQKEIDLNLAKMIVEAELDLKLF